MKLLFLARHWSYLRNFESAVAERAARGHHVHMAVDVEEALGGRQMIERLVARYPDRLSMSNAPDRAVGAWSELARRIRHSLDYLRFLEPRYQATPHLGARARERAPGLLLRALALPYFQTDRGRARLASILRALERALPRSRDLEAFVSAHEPDAVLVWNEVQKTEAIEMHGVPADRVLVTGAQCYDQWWNRAPSRSREAFCT